MLFKMKIVIIEGTDNVGKDTVIKTGESDYDSIIKLVNN